MKAAWLLLPCALLAAACQDGTGTGSAPARQAAPPPQVLALLRENGCIHCHTIAGVTGATGRIGPPLSNFSQRPLISGQQPNTTANLTRFLLDPRSLSPGSAMPSTLTREADARVLAAWLRGEES